jgi:methionine biosynthesis protein MetW
MSYDTSSMRFDLRMIASWIKPESKVLGLGCGDGELLHFLKQDKRVKETGIEIKESRVASCIEKGLSVLQGDINEEILDYPDKHFDYVILSQTLQQVYEPAHLIRAMLRVGNMGVVSFPNFCHWRIRLQVLWKGNVPKTRELPYEWYNTPNIRVLSLKDFRAFSRRGGFTIIKEAAVRPDKSNKEGQIITTLPNIFATYGIFLISNRNIKA